MSKERIESTLKSCILVDTYTPYGRPEAEIKARLVNDIAHYLMEKDLVNFHTLENTSPGGYTLYEAEITIVKYEG